MPMYKLRFSFFDGAQHYRAGQVVEIEEGKAPSSAIRQDVPEPKLEPGVEPELDLAPSVIDAKPGDTLASIGKKK